MLTFMKYNIYVALFHFNSPPKCYFAGAALGAVCRSGEAGTYAWDK
jgi:hypothetical protein